MKAKEQLPKCSNCKRGRSIPLTNDVICPIKGVVSANYSCKRYAYDVFLLKSKRKRTLNTGDFSHGDFSITNMD